MKFLEKNLFSDPAHAFREIWKSGGVVALQRGLTFTLIRDISGYAAYFTTIFYTQKYFDQIGISPFVGSFVAGGLGEGTLLYSWEFDREN